MWQDSFISSYSFIGVTWLLHVCDKTRSIVWHDFFVGVTWLLQTSDMTFSLTPSRVWRYFFTSVTWHALHVTHVKESIKKSCHSYEGVMSHLRRSHVTHLIESCDTQKCMTSARLSTCDMTHSRARHDSFMCVSWRTSQIWQKSMYEMAHLYVWHHSCTPVTWVTYEIWREDMCGMTHSFM